MRTVVTGAAGFVGSHLVEALLERGDDVTCIERPGAARGWLRNLEVAFHDCGLDDRAALEKLVCPADVVYHLAALTEARSATECLHVNTQGTANVTAAAAACGVTPPRVVLMSSLAAVGPPAVGDVLTGDTPPVPLSVYGRSKLQAEAVVHAYADRVPGVVCRFPTIYGPRDRMVLKLFRMVAHGFALTIGPWNRRVSVIHVDDAVAGLIAAGTTGAAVGRTYHLAHPQPVSWGQFVAAIGRALGRRPRKIAVPTAAARPIAMAAETAAWLSGRAAALNRDRVREISQSSWVCDVLSALEEIGFAPNYELDTGVAATAVWLRRNRWI